MGFKVIAVDTGEQKREVCPSLGASHFVDFKHPDSTSETKTQSTSPTQSETVSQILALTEGQGAHVAILYGGGTAAYFEAATYLRTAGCLMLVGVPKDVMLQMPVILVIGKALTIKGISAA